MRSFRAEAARKSTADRPIPPKKPANDYSAQEFSYPITLLPKRMITLLITTLTDNSLRFATDKLTENYI